MDDCFMLIQIPLTLTNSDRMYILQHREVLCGGIFRDIKDHTGIQPDSDVIALGLMIFLLDVHGKFAYYGD